MICKSCNNNIPNDSKYCPFCGAQAHSGQSDFSEKLKNILRLMKEKFFIFTEPIAEYRLLFVSVVALLILNPISAAFKIFKVTENLTGSNMFSVSYSLYEFLGEGAEDIPVIYFLIVLGIIFILFCCASLLFPLITKKEYTYKYVIPTNVASVICTFSSVFLFLLFMIYNKSNGLDDFTKFNVTFSGVMFCAISIALIPVSFKFTSELKKKNKRNKTEDFIK